MRPLSGGIVDSHVTALEVDPVQLFDAHGGLLGRGHLDETETTRSAGLRVVQDDGSFGLAEDGQVMKVDGTDLLVIDDGHALDLAVLLEHVVEIGFLGPQRQSKDPETVGRVRSGDGSTRAAAEK